LIPASIPRRLREEWKEKYGIAEDDIVIGRVGHCWDEKGFPEFVSVAKSVVSKCQAEGKTPHFILCGVDSVDGNREVETQLEEAGIRQYCHLLGTRPDMPQVYSAMRVHLSLSRFESFGLVLFEAAACGVPSAGTDVGAHKKIEGEGIKIFPPRTSPLSSRPDLWNTESVVDAVMKLIKETQSPQGQKEMAQSLIKRTASFSLERMVQRLSSLLDGQIDLGAPKSLVSEDKLPPFRPITRSVKIRYPRILRL